MFNDYVGLFCFLIFWMKKACLDSGFFYVVNHGISQEFMDEVFAQSKNFFGLPWRRRLSFWGMNIIGDILLFLMNYLILRNKCMVNMNSLFFDHSMHVFFLFIAQFCVFSFSHCVLLFVIGLSRRLQRRILYWSWSVRGCFCIK